MRQSNLFARALLCLVIGASLTIVSAQSLTDRLKEEDQFYMNYGKESYAKLKIEKDVVGLYDMFGEHIVDGVNLYELSNKNSRLDNSNLGVHDSVDTSRAREYQKRDFYEKFSNLVITQDAIGGLKTSFLIGDQITTRFTPLIFNKVNFRGIRWDLWSSGLQFSAILSRTRPGFTSQKDWDGTGDATVQYPLSDGSTFPLSAYTWAGMGGKADFTNKSPYGDYDFLWGLHAQNNIANKVDVGLSIINHHVNDIRRGWHPFKGDLPDSLMPNSIHFEFFDLTPEDTLDAGVFVDSVIMYVNGKPVEAESNQRGVFMRAFTGDQDNVLLPRDIPIARPQSGYIPVIVEFQTDPKYWQYPGPRPQTEANIKAVKKISFRYKVAGNYLVFVSTDRQIPVAIKGEYNPQTRKNEYTYPAKSVGDIYDQGLKVNASGSATSWKADYYYSTTYFGDYIAQSPKRISVGVSDFTHVCDQSYRGQLYANKERYNYREYEYTYNINVSSVTYGVNFKGELGGVKFSGEAALNKSEDMLPGSESSRNSEYKWVGELRAEKEMSKSIGLSGEAYYISPQWATNMRNFKASQYFNQTNYKQNGTDRTWAQPGPTGIIKIIRFRPNRLTTVGPISKITMTAMHFRKMNGAGIQATWTHRATAAIFTGMEALPGNQMVRSLKLPNGMYVPYDDPDGVVASKNDKNKNATPDYLEDFLLFASDPPIFELGIDLNNNGVPDYEDDDILPDLGHSVGYVITGDGFTTQGIGGGNVNVRWTPMDNTTLDVGVIGEMAIDHDLVDSTTMTDEGMLANFDDKSVVLYGTLKQEVLKRSQGLQYDFGLELRGIMDALRNDAVKTDYNNKYAEDYSVSYRYWYDPLDFRRAAVGNGVAGITYNNIRNFEYGLRVKVGAEKHLAIPEQLYYIPYTFGTKWQPYQDRTIGDFNFVNRVQYRIGINMEYEDWRSMFNFLSRLEIIPQYKFAVTFREEVQGPPETQNDPRNLRYNMEQDVDGDGVIDTSLDIGTVGDTIRSIQERWTNFKRYHESYLLNVPILKANYKIAENTTFQLGLQWLRYVDFVSSENNAFKFTTLAQIVSKANYKGYSVTFFLGGRWMNSIYDINQHDPVLSSIAGQEKIGSWYNQKSWEVFAKLFSGI